MPRTLDVDIERWPLTAPLRIANGVFAESEVATVTITDGAAVGRGEASGVFYLDDTVDKIIGQIEAVRGEIVSGTDRDALQTLLPPGGARNALDCALWDLEAKLTGTPAWQRAGLDRPQPRVTTWTIGADTPAAMARTAQAMNGWQAIKLKLLGDGLDGARVAAVRGVCPEAWIGVDANQGWSLAKLADLMPGLVEARVALIEQPLPRGRDAELDGFASPIVLAADESAQTSADLEALVGRYQVVNIKLDKCGGLTEGLAMARAARDLGLRVMVGNMTGTSLGMAPAFLIAQLCDEVDLDGPLMLAADRSPSAEYVDSRINCPTALWG